LKIVICLLRQCVNLTLRLIAIED